MTTYIGTAVPRVDGKAKVTGAAKYAGEFNVPGLAHGAVVTSTVAKGKITAIDTSAALAVEGVLSVLTHENRPSMAESDSAYKDDVAPDGSPFRPLYNANVLFSGQPIALVLAETWEAARFAASLVRPDYQEKAHATDLFKQRGDAFTLSGKAFAMSLANPRGDAPRAFAAADVRHEADYFVPVEHHNPMELYA
ncbi:MAG: xanthine dehydrogenase family protein molybdopterin-binding subunit, partial [Rhodomicrobium sp.]